MERGSNCYGRGRGSNGYGRGRGTNGYGRGRGGRGRGRGGSGVGYDLGNGRSGIGRGRGFGHQQQQHHYQHQQQGREYSQPWTSASSGGLHQKYGHNQHQQQNQQQQSGSWRWRSGDLMTQVETVCSPSAAGGGGGHGRRRSGNPAATPAPVVQYSDEIKALSRYISHLQSEANQIKGLLRVIKDKLILDAIPPVLLHLNDDESKASMMMKALVEAEGSHDEYEVKMKVADEEQVCFYTYVENVGFKLMRYAVKFSYFFPEFQMGFLDTNRWYRGMSNVLKSSSNKLMEMEKEKETTNVSERFHWELIMEGKSVKLGEFVMLKMVASILEYGTILSFLDRKKGGQVLVLTHEVIQLLQARVELCLEEVRCIFEFLQMPYREPGRRKQMPRICGVDRTSKLLKGSC